MPFRTMSAVLITPEKKEYIEIVDVLKNYTEWSYKHKEIPEVVAAEFVVSLCPKLAINRVIKMFIEFNEMAEMGKVVEIEEFVDDYLSQHEILRDQYLIREAG